LEEASCAHYRVLILKVGMARWRDITLNWRKGYRSLSMSLVLLLLGLRLISSFLFAYVLSSTP
jgi:ABC-type thiamin/hydroxymethylpyrimidine transport system permease subunit